MTALGTVTSLGTRMTTAETNITTNTTNIASNTSAITALQTAAPYAILKRNANQSIADSTVTAVQWNAEDADSDNGHSTSVSNSRYTAPRTGLYLVTCSIPWVANASGLRELNFQVNGTTSYAGHRFVAGAAVGVVSSSSHMISMTSGDYVEATVWQNTGGSLNIDQSFATGPHFEIIFLR